MRDVLNTPVLVLNAYWVIVNEVSARVAFLQLAADAATALDTSDGCFTPTKWAEWIKLPIREGDDKVGTPRGFVRVPRVIIAINYAKVVAKRPRLTMAALRKRDANKCAYSGEELDPQDSSMEHVVPRSKGGKRIWENIVLAHKKVNSKRGNKPLREVGLKLKRTPFVPKPVTKAEIISPKFPEWERFLGKR